MAEILKFPKIADTCDSFLYPSVREKFDLECAAEKKAQNASNAAVQRLSVLFAQFQNTYSSMSALLNEIRVEEPELSSQLTSALRGILSKMEGGLSS